jgi:hypothetical protein
VLLVGCWWLELDPAGTSTSVSGLNLILNPGFGGDIVAITMSEYEGGVVGIIG